MIENQEGFFYPKVNTEKCVGCSKCDKVCHLNSESIPLNPEPFSARLTDRELLQKSASGGAFAGLVMGFLLRGGAVCGCAYDENMNPRHIMIEDVLDLEKLQGSKYVESDLGDIFERTRQTLQNGKKVFFSGTGCQIAALKAYLGKDDPNLYTADIICHGVPSRKLFLEYVRILGRKRKVINYRFRSKSRQPWGEYAFECVYDDGTRRYGSYEDSFYYRSFLDGANYRESCYVCKYAGMNRQGDFTLGDFWGAEVMEPELNSKEGVSLLLVNTQKGRDFIESEEIGLNLRKADLKYAVSQQRNLQMPTERPEKRNDFYRQANRGLLRLVLCYSLKQRIKRFLRRIGAFK